jgi:hypothetical protein
VAAALAFGLLQRSERDGSIRPAVLAAGPEVRREAPTEYELKAVCLLHFLKLNTWPEEAFDDERDRRAPFVLVVMGDDPFGEDLEQAFKGERPQERAVVLRRLEELPRDSDVLNAHLVFSTLSRSRDRRELIERTSGRPVLLVGEVEGFAQQGACMNFYLEGKKVRFEVNVDAVERSGLRVSADILKLARIVREQADEPSEELR